MEPIFGFERNHKNIKLPLDNGKFIIYIKSRIGKFIMNKNYAINFSFEAEASAEAYFAYALQW